MRKTLVILTILTVLTTYSPILCQTIDNTTNNGLPTRFPARFAGDDPISIYQKLEKYKNALLKSEFETTAEFVSRIRKFTKSLSLSKTQKADDQLTIVTFDFDESYDADLETYTVALNLTSDFWPDYELSRLNGAVNDQAATTSKSPIKSDETESVFSKFDRTIGTGIRWQSLELTSGSRNLGTAVGQNAFGVRRKYRIKTYNSLRLAIYSNLDGRKLSFSITPNEAKSIKGHLKVAVIGTLRYPFVSKNQSSDSATLTEPEESHYLNYYLLFEPKSLALYDIRSGRIYKTVEIPLAGPVDTKESRALSVYKPEAASVKLPDGKTMLLYTAEQDRGQVSGKDLPKSRNQATDSEVGPGPLVQPSPVNGGAMNGKAISLPKALYPPAARAVRASGAVSVQVLIDENGNVVSASAVSGHPLLRAAAVSAAHDAKFSPTKIGGQSVKVSGVITYNFVP